MELDGAAGPSHDQLKTLALTNYGHFTSLLVKDGRVRGLSLHLERLARDSKLLFDTELDADHVRYCIRRAVRDTDGSGVVRITHYDPALDLGSIGSDASPVLLVTARMPASGAPSPLRLQAAAYQREMPAVKHVGLFGAMHRRRSAQREGFDDVLFLNPDGTISEIATSNIGFVRGGRIVWPRSTMLWGVTMSLLCQELDETIDAEPLTLADLADMDAAFATNAAVGVRPVTSVDDVAWPSVDHPALTELSDLYAGIPSETV